MAGGIREGLSVRAFAKELGIDEKAVRSRIKAGKRIAEAVLEDGSLDPDRARALWWVDLDTSNMRGKPAARPSIVDAADEAIELNRVRARREAADLAVVEHKLDELRNNSIDKAQARRTCVTFARMHRDASLNFAARQGPELASKWGLDPRVVIGDLEAAIRNMLADLAKEAVPFE